MTSALVTAAAFLIAALMIPVLDGPARRIGLTDKPTRRKRHNGSVPLTGGLAMFMAILTAFGMHSGQPIDYTSLIAGMATLLAMGLIDDLVELRAIFRLLIQILVASVAVIWSGLQVHELGALLGPAFGPIGLGPFSSLFTILSIVFLVNVINMADGVDGLAGGIALLFFSMLAGVAWMSGAPSSLLNACLVMAAATAGFLIWNMRFPFRKHASAFMGDAGSMMLGFGAAWLAIAVATMPEGGQRAYPIVIVWILLVPSMDTIAIMLRRISQGRSPMAPDRAHLHHIMRRIGLSVTTTVSLIHLAVLFSGLAGILAWQAGVPEWLLFAVATALIVGYTIALINARRILRWGLRRRSRLVYNKPTIARVKGKGKGKA